MALQWCASLRPGLGWIQGYPCGVAIMFSPWAEDGNIGHHSLSGNAKSLAELAVTGVGFLNIFRLPAAWPCA